MEQGIYELPLNERLRTFMRIEFYTADSIISAGQKITGRLEQQYTRSLKYTQSLPEPMSEERF